jgi:hypothetical protein
MTPPIVFAYLDPGTGSYLLQLALASILGASYAVKHFWARIRSLFSRSGPPVSDDARS